jgi:hypothetical protein
MEIELSSIGYEDDFEWFNRASPVCAGAGLRAHIFDPAVTQYAQKIAPTRVGVEAQAKLTVGWGDKDGPTVNGSMSGSVKDNKGNQAEVKVEMNNQGSKTVTISAEHKDNEGSGYSER